MYVVCNHISFGKKKMYKTIPIDIKHFNTATLYKYNYVHTEVFIKIVYAWNKTYIIIKLFITTLTASILHVNYKNISNKFFKLI